MPLPNNSSPDQLRQQALAKIQEATDAVRQYRLYGAPRDRRENVDSINESTVDFVKKAYAVGAAGQSCPTCGGSGRV